MKKIKFLTFFVVILFVCSLCFLNVGAAPTPIPALTNKNVDITTISGGKIVVIQDISSLAKDLLGETGGRLTASISYSGSNEANIAMTYDINPSKTLTAQEANGAVSLEITFFVGDQSKLTTLKITSASLTAYPNEVTPTPTQSSTPTPTTQTQPVTPSASTEPSDSVSPTPTDVIQDTPTGSDGAETPSVSPTDIITTQEPTPKITQEPTKRPTVTPDTTKDNYVSNWQTQAPPTLPPDVTVDPNITTAPDPTPEPLKKTTDSPSSSFFIFFMVLIGFLIIDIFLIIWRKNAGYGYIVNNGITRRKVRDDLVNTPENAEPIEIPEETPQEE